MHRSARHSIAKKTLPLTRTSLAIRSLCPIPVAPLQVPFFFPLIRQNLSLRTPITVILGIINKLRAVILRASPASFKRTLPLARLIHTGRDELDFPLVHRHNIVPTDKSTVGYHLLGRLAEILFHSLDARL